MSKLDGGKHDVTLVTSQLMYTILAPTKDYEKEAIEVTKKAKKLTHALARLPKLQDEAKTKKLSKLLFEFIDTFSENFSLVLGDLQISNMTQLHELTTFIEKVTSCVMNADQSKQRISFTNKLTKPYQIITEEESKDGSSDEYHLQVSCAAFADPKARQEILKDIQ